MIENIIEYNQIPERDEITKISKKFNLNSHVATLLIQRIGFNINEISKFLDTDINNLYDPFIFKNIKECI